MPRYGFYADITLDAAHDTPVALSFENGGHSVSGSIRWASTDVLTTDRITIRKGDSLRLTAIDSNNPTDQMITVSIDDSSAMNSTESATVPYLFHAAGSYTISASVGNLSGTLQVIVLEAELGAPLSVFKDTPKNWTPEKLSQDAFVESDNHLLLDEMVASTPRSFSVRALDTDTRYIAARLSDGGPVMDHLAVTGFELASNTQARVEVVDTLDDGAVLVEVDIVLDNVPANLIIEARIFVGGVTFADGSVVRVLTAADFGTLGRATLQFLMPFEATSSICHRLHMYLGDEYIGQF